MFSKVTVKGSDKPPIYAAILAAAQPSSDISWNFEKFLIGKDGVVMGRYKSGVRPDAAELTQAIEAALAK
jgi:glutathione peroxidase